MRKTILFAAVLLSVFSCKVDDGNYNIVDSLKLSEYGSNVVISYIEPCASMMFFLLELDTFEAMTSEEQKESWLNGFVLHLDENTLSMETGYYEATFHTGGKSIRDAGTEWKVDNYCGYYYYNNYAFDVVVRCAGDGVLLRRKALTVSPAHSLFQGVRHLLTVTGHCSQIQSHRVPLRIPVRMKKALQVLISICQV